ncbi:MAG: 3-isopropylmalate dehydratase large subunit [Planctomycetes bacterium]|nr:3-isopropylmalate dehydratase large subunit [Planctomycetota bacterium]
MNLVEKIFAKHAGKKSVVPGEIIMAECDVIMGNDLSTSLSIDIFRENGFKKVLYPDKLAIVMSHFVPAKDIMTAKLCQKVRDWVKQHKIKNYIEAGKGGIEHVVLPDEGFIKPCDLIVGGDSHSVTYGAFGAAGIGIGSTDLVFAWVTGKLWFKVPPVIKIIYKGKKARWVYAKDMILLALRELTSSGALYKGIEFDGEAVAGLDIAGRTTLANMTAELGAKCGIIKADQKTIDHLNKTRLKGTKFDMSSADSDAKYEKIVEFDLTKIEPQIAQPYSPDNVCDVSDLKRVKVNQVYIGSCTNGRVEDLRIAAQLLKGKKVHSDVRMIVTPASQNAYLSAINEGLVQIFIEAGAAVSTPTCGACLGGFMGIVGPKEVCVSTTNRNYPGRMGDREALVYLANPAVAAASAITGRITHPEEINVPVTV